MVQHKNEKLYPYYFRFSINLIEWFVEPKITKRPNKDESNQDDFLSAKKGIENEKKSL